MEEGHRRWHGLGVGEVLSLLSTSPSGLTRREAEERLSRFGPNEIRAEGGPSALRILASQFANFLVGLLLVSLAISLLLGELYDAAAIGAIVAANAVIGFYQDYRAERAMEALKRLVTPMARVVREGETLEIPARELVPGDVVLIEAGDRIPADARLIESFDLEVDESVLTGESGAVSKEAGVVLPPDTPLQDRMNMVYMGTVAVRGAGRAAVVSTGMETEFGRIASMVQEIEREETPLMRRLGRFGRRLGALVFVLAVAASLAQLIHGLPPVSSFMTAVALAVSAVPEGLPAVVTVTLAFGMREMARRNALVRRLSSVETLGSTTVICSDKTGTITKNEMTVRVVYVPWQEVAVSGTGYEPVGEFTLPGGGEVPADVMGAVRETLLGMALCSSSEIREEGGRWIVVGDPTEGALLAAAAKAGIWREEALASRPLVDEVPFESARKSMTTVHRVGDGLVAYTKGAPEVILEICDRISVSGEVREMRPEDRERLLEVVEALSSRALRVLAVGYREVREGEGGGDASGDGLVFLGLAAMMDPPREEVAGALARCRAAGIRVIMITGDHRSTAVAVAREIGLLSGGEEGRVFTGAEIDAMGEEEFMEAVRRAVVFARVSPEHKLRITSALQREGHVVAVTGDGVNDAPALKKADIGVAMGIKGTEVAKEAADMVLLDDNFATIVGAVEAGRVVYDNIRKFIRFLLACNFDEIAVIATSAMLGLPLPLRPIQILWLNLATDGLPATALAFDPPEEDVMSRPPRRPGEGILHGMLRFVAASAVMQYAGTMLTFAYSYLVLGESYPEANTLAFTQAVLFELLVVFNCRSDTRSVWRLGILGNKKLLASVIAMIALHVAVIYLPPLQATFGTAPLTATDWTITFAAASGGLLVLPEVFIRGRAGRGGGSE